MVLYQGTTFSRAVKEGLKELGFSPWRNSSPGVRLARLCSSAHWTGYIDVICGSVWVLTRAQLAPFYWLVILRMVLVVLAPFTVGTISTRPPQVVTSSAPTMVEVV